ncbi:MAG: PEP-CTERM system TPR-repeat protein PrsT [Gammaproteobacteria bacterium]|nr:PEP-CTERM system TPR-repeat protein PrsT [Gammaproteobacteria bacterium]
MTEFTKILLLSFGILIASCSPQQTTEEYLQSGQKLISQKEWKGAIIEFKNAVKQSPDNANARFLLGDAYLHTFSSNAAIKELKRSIELGHNKDAALILLAKAYQQINENERILDEIKISPAQPAEIKAGLYALRATAYLALKKPDEAKTELELARKFNENNSDVRLAWAQYEKQKNNIDAQIMWLKPLIENSEPVAEALSHMGEIEQQTTNFPAAEIAFTQAIKLRGVVHLDTVKRAMVRIAMNNHDGAMEDIVTLKRAGYQWPMIGYAEGLIAYQQKKYDAAKSLFEGVLSNYPDYVPARLLIGLTHFNKGNYQNAVTNLEVYLSSVPDAVQANFIYAASLLKLGKPKEAITVLEKLEQIEPNDFKILSLLGNAYLADKQMEKGLHALSKAVEIEPNQARTRLQLGAALLREESGIKDAQLQLIKAIELDPDLYQADIALYMSYIRNKNFIQARKIAQTLKEKQSNTTLGANLLALSYLADGNKSLALKELKETLKLFPSDPATSDNLARIYLQDNQFSEAKSLYLTVLEKFPSDLKSMHQLALIAFRERENEKILEWLKKAFERNPQVLSARLLLANLYVQRNESGLALQLLQSVETEYKDDPNYSLLLAKAKIGIGEYQHATRILKSLVSRSPSLSSGHFLLAQSYAYQNDKINLRASLENTIKYSPDHLSAHLMLAKLDLLDKNIDRFKKRVAMLIKAYPDNKDVQLLNAKVESSEKGFDSAINTLSALMSEVPSSEVVIDLSKNYWNSGKKDSAITSLELWLAKNNDDKNALMLLAQYYLAESRASEAKNTYQEMDRLLPNNAVVLNNLAWLMMDTDVKQGIVYAEKALSIESDNPLIADTLAMLLLKNGDSAKALIHSQFAAKKLPNIVDIQMNYAKVLSANNQKDAAREILKNLLRNTKDYDKRKTISKELNNL